jgi:hypothetical protein
LDLIFDVGSTTQLSGGQAGNGCVHASVRNFWPEMSTSGCGSQIRLSLDPCSKLTFPKWRRILNRHRCPCQREIFQTLFHLENIERKWCQS